ncbi:hypothetical protein NEMBOFW57_005768 [Staphylotrichum longicolle]|uniref:Uncharacterized protein n=1 Tax=Staphylotrichum longicolle TaxID=669026 RepID=A0AAD4HYU1_9PEZI|nr:hypothetical protein NEMBOFW57_005768 [Staphylotrichum longicolle]
MATATTIPVAVFGKDPKIARSVCEKLLPDFDAVHVCLDLPTALAELPALFSIPTTTTTTSLLAPAACPLGSNAARARPVVPQAVFFGGKFSDAEYRAIVDAVSSAAATAAVDSTKQQQQQQNERQHRGSGSGSGGSGDCGGAGARRVHFVKVQKLDVLAAGGFGPNAEVIAKVFRKKMAAALEKEEGGAAAAASRKQRM